MFDPLYHGQYAPEQREMEALSSVFNGQMIKLNALYEAVNANYKADQYLAEARILTENGTCSQLLNLYTEASEAVAEKKIGILQKIVGAIRSLIAKIRNFIDEKILSKFRSKGNEEVEVPTGLTKVADGMDKGYNGISGAIGNLKSKAVNGWKGLGTGCKVLFSILGIASFAAIGAGVISAAVKKNGGEKKEKKKVSFLLGIITRLRQWADQCDAAVKSGEDKNWLKKLISSAGAAVNTARGRISEIKNGKTTDASIPPEQEMPEFEMDSAMDAPLTPDDIFFTEKSNKPLVDKDAINKAKSMVKNGFEFVTTVIREVISGYMKLCQQMIQYILKLLGTTENE